MHDHGFEVALVQGLANLKESVEEPGDDAEELPDDGEASDDEAEEDGER
jgi:hypothetical protein